MLSTVRYSAFLAMALVLQSSYTCVTANFNIPFLTPLLDNVCTENLCGKGKCVSSGNSTFGFVCECDSGWKQARLEEDDGLKFMPCVIPNCTFNYDCKKSPPPTPDKEKDANQSIFDPCYFADCGGGTCNKTSVFTHTCLCEEGYHNLLNATSFPCYKECALGVGCENLGLGLTNTSNSIPKPNLADNSNSHGANLVPRDELVWLSIMLSSLTLAVRNYA